MRTEFPPFARTNLHELISPITLPQLHARMAVEMGIPIPELAGGARSAVSAVNKMELSHPVTSGLERSPEADTVVAKK